MVREQDAVGPVRHRRGGSLGQFGRTRRIERCAGHPAHVHPVVGKRCDRGEHRAVIFVGHRAEHERDVRRGDAHVAKRGGERLRAIRVVRGGQEHVADRPRQPFETTWPFGQPQAGRDGPFVDPDFARERDGDLRVLALVGARERGRMSIDEARELFIVREPVGVVAAIVPWNMPQFLIVTKLVPALLAGCCVVVKPAPETPLDALLLAEIAAEAELPAGVVNVVTGGADAGAHLVAHPAVDKVSFTGSTAAGRQVAAACAANLTKVTLELGGKSAAVVLDDADPAAVATAVRLASLSPVTTATAERLGWTVAAEAAEYTWPGLMAAIVGTKSAG